MNEVEWESLSLTGVDAVLFRLRTPTGWLVVSGYPPRAVVDVLEAQAYPSSSLVYVPDPAGTWLQAPAASAKEPESDPDEDDLVQAIKEYRMVTFEYPNFKKASTYWGHDPVFEPRCVVLRSHNPGSHLWTCWDLDKQAFRIFDDQRWRNLHLTGQISPPPSMETP